MHKVADMMESPEWRNGDQWDNPIDLDMPWEPEPPPTHAELERTASSVMDAVSADHQVVHDAITGDVEPGNEFRDQFKVNSEHLLYNLTHEEWDDNGAAAARCSTGRSRRRRGRRPASRLQRRIPMPTTSARTRTT